MTDELVEGFGKAGGVRRKRRQRKGDSPAVQLPSRAANLIAAYKAYGGTISHTVAASSPATITDLGASVFSSGIPGLSQEYDLLAPPALFSTKGNSFGGAPFEDGNHFARFPCATSGTSGGNINNTGISGQVWRVSVYSDAPTLGWYILTGSQFRILVNDVYQNLTPSSFGTGGGDAVSVACGSRQLRKHTFEGCASDGIYGVTGASGDIIEKFPYSTLARMVVVGDSFTSSSGATNTADGWSQVLGDLLGVADTWSSGVGGTGYLATGTAPVIYNLTQRLGDVNNNGPWDAIVVAMGLNDSGLAQASIQANVNTCLSSFQTNNPNTPIFVVGLWDVNAPLAPASTYASVKAAIQAGMVGVPNCFFIDMQGVAYEQVGGGNIHPDTNGHATLANNIFGKIKSILGVA